LNLLEGGLEAGMGAPAGNSIALLELSLFRLNLTGKIRENFQAVLFLDSKTLINRFPISNTDQDNFVLT